MKQQTMRVLLIAAAALCPWAAGLRAQQIPVKHASDFSELEYFDPPNQMQISSHLTGSEAVPQLGGLILIKQMRLETFETNGEPKLIVEAPECLYDQLKNTANSSGHLKVRQADGQVQHEGEGFLWLGDDESLTISNQVRTVVMIGPNSKKIMR